MIRNSGEQEEEPEESFDVSFNPLRHSRRRDDNNIAAKLSTVSIKFHWVVTLLFAFFLALGFDFKTPAKAFAEVREAIGTVRTKDSIEVFAVRQIAEKGEVERIELKSLLVNAVILQCLDATKDNIRVSRVPCIKILSDAGVAP